MVEKDLILEQIKVKKQELNEMLPKYVEKAKNKEEEYECYKEEFNKSLNELLNLYREFHKE